MATTSKRRSAKPVPATGKSSNGGARPVGTSSGKRQRGRPMSVGTPSDFIRSMPNATTAEVMAAAQKAGIRFSRGLVYMVRTKGAGTKPRAAGGKAKSSSSAKPRAGAAPRGRRRQAPRERGFDTRAVKSAILAIVAEHGLLRVRAIVEEVGADLRGALDR